MATEMVTTEEFLSAKYDELYEKASQILKKYNPCQVENWVCERGRQGGENFCCRCCEHLSKKGCTVKALYCRVWLCNYALQNLRRQNKIEDFGKEINEVYSEADKYHFFLF
jgi:hypothetical protein